MRDAIIRSALDLHGWRERHNGAEFGLGYDQFRPDERCHYAEAWAFWGRGYLRLYRLSGECAYLERAQAAAHWLLAHPSHDSGHDSGHLAWGLPWCWERWNAPATLAYLVTTVLVGEFLVDLYATTGQERHLSAARDAASWIEIDNGGERSQAGLRLYYCNYPQLTFPVTNPTAKASGFFAGLYQATRETRYKSLYQETCRWVLGQQRGDGSWAYSSQSRVTDNVHTGFTLEGLWTAYRILRQPALRHALERGTHYYWRHCFQPSGRGLEQAISGWRDLGRISLKAWVRDRLAQWNQLPGSLVETRLHGYASAIRVWSLAGEFDPRWLKVALGVYQYVQGHLCLPDGSYAYRQNTPRAYIRQQGHLFDALCCLAEQLR